MPNRFKVLPLRTLNMTLNFGEIAILLVIPGPWTLSFLMRNSYPGDPSGFYALLFMKALQISNTELFPQFSMHMPHSKDALRQISKIDFKFNWPQSSPILVDGPINLKSPGLFDTVSYLNHLFIHIFYILFGR